MKIEFFKKKTTVPLYLVIYLICAILGAAQGGLLGLAIGFVSAVLCSLLTITGIVPFAGIFIYFWATGELNNLLGGLGANVSVAMTVSWVFFGFLAGIIWFVVSAIALIAILRLALG